MKIDMEIKPNRSSTIEERKFYPFTAKYSSSCYLNNGAIPTAVKREEDYSKAGGGSRSNYFRPRSLTVTVAAAALDSHKILDEANKNKTSENDFLFAFQKNGVTGILSWTTNRMFPFLSGVVLSLNFLIFWAVPVAGMGSLYKHTPLKRYLRPIYYFLENHSAVRNFASCYVYENPQHAVFFVMLVLLCSSAFISAGVMFYTQLSTGALPVWLVAAYYCCWVGIGGSMMGTAYGFSHKEGHNRGMYKKWIRTSVGNLVENWIGMMFGNVPYNFSTSHGFIHHRLD
eukprot:gene31160-41514_t